MIRKFKESDLPRIMQIWLSANKEAHGFIKESYWDENFEAVKAALPYAEVYIHENAEAEPDGFIGLNGGHIEVAVRRQNRTKHGHRKRTAGFCKK